MVLTGNPSKFLHSITQQLNNAFSLKDLGDLDYFLGTKVNTHPLGSLLLTQSKYIWDLLLKIDMHESAPLAIPMSSSSKLIKVGSPQFNDPTFFRSIVDSL